MISLTPDLDRAVKQLGWTTFTPVQELAIPALRSGRDLFAQAQTGTGKTGAFALPILERVEGRAGVPFTLVVVPTRELGQQVAREIEVLGRFRHARVVALYGGVGYRAQEDALRRGAHVVVGTPGRLLDLASRRTNRRGSGLSSPSPTGPISGLDTTSDWAQDRGDRKSVV